MNPEDIKAKMSYAEVSQDKFGVIWVKVPLEKVRDALKTLLDEGFTHLTTITGHDTGEVIRLIYNLLGDLQGKNKVINVVTEVDRENSVAPSIMDLFPSALIYEREVYDLLGVKFEGHKGLKRLLLPEDTPEGFHPLRKDFKG